MKEHALQLLVGPFYDHNPSFYSAILESLLDYLLIRGSGNERHFRRKVVAYACSLAEKQSKGTHKGEKSEYALLFANLHTELRPFMDAAQLEKSAKQVFPPKKGSDAKVHFNLYSQDKKAANDYIIPRSTLLCCIG